MNLLLNLPFYKSSVRRNWCTHGNVQCTSLKLATKKRHILKRYKKSRTNCFFFLFVVNRNFMLRSVHLLSLNIEFYDKRKMIKIITFFLKVNFSQMETFLTSCTHYQVFFTPIYLYVKYLFLFKLYGFNDLHLCCACEIWLPLNLHFVTCFLP